MTKFLRAHLLRANLAVILFAAAQIAWADAPTPIATAIASPKGTKVTVEGEVSAFRAAWSPTAPNLVTLKDPTGEVPLAIWADAFAKITPAPAVGARVKATGEYAPFRDKPQIKVTAPETVFVTAAGAPAAPAATPAPAAPAAPQPSATPEAAPSAAPAPAAGTTAINTITEAMLKQPATIEGEVTAVRESRGGSSPFNFTVKDATGSIAVVIWPDAYAAVAEKPGIGARISASGEISKYRENLQIKMSKGEDLKVLKAGGAPVVGDAASAVPAAPTPTPTPIVTPAPAAGSAPSEKVEIGKIAEDWNGKEITITGKITQLKPSWGEKAPNILEVRDGTGRFAVLIWPDVFATLVPAPAIGLQITATGKVGDFRGQRQITVLSTGGAIVANAAPAPPAQP